MIDYKNLKPEDILATGRIKKYVMFLKNIEEGFLVFHFNKRKIITYYFKKIHLSDNISDYNYKKIQICELFKD